MKPENKRLSQVQSTSSWISQRKGMSAVVTVVILIALTIAIVAIVWTVVNNLVGKELGTAGSCLGILDKVSLNSEYTCYDSNEKELWFSIIIKDIEVDAALISISGDGTSMSFEFNKTSSPSNPTTYPSRGTDAVLPGKNSGLTYIFDLSAAGFTGEPDSIEIAPIINDNQCSVSDSISQFDSCSSMTG